MYNHYAAGDHECLEATREVSNRMIESVENEDTGQRPVAGCEKSGAGGRSLRASCSCSNGLLLASVILTGQSPADVILALRTLRRQHHRRCMSKLGAAPPLHD
jgi:hypothetical protein